MTDVLLLENDHWQVGLVPTTGGSVAFGRVNIGGHWRDVMRPTPEALLASVPDTASYPLVPWSNRILHGKLAWAGRTYQLRVNHGDGNAIHGTASEYPWSVVESSPTHAVLEFVSRDVYGVNFPWTFTARFTYRLEGDAFVWTYGLTNTDHETFPAGFGHHPYFERSVAGSTTAHLQLNVATAYEAEGCIPFGEAGEIRPDADFRASRQIGGAFVDDCYTDRTSPTLATITWPGALELDMVADDLLSHAVVYIPDGKPFFAVEPVSNANDAFNLAERGIHSANLLLVQPGQTVTASFSLIAKPLA
jgi:aldose 1-epimerase